MLWQCADFQVEMVDILAYLLHCDLLLRLRVDALTQSNGGLHASYAS